MKTEPKQISFAKSMFIGFQISLGSAAVVLLIAFLIESLMFMGYIK